MNRLKSTILLTCSLIMFGFANAQWHNKFGFCGAALRKYQLDEIKPQAQFLKLKENDTIVDIGASSGWFQGALACVSPVKNINFVLVDIDSACLNLPKIIKMTEYYANMKGGEIDYKYEMVVNKQDDLALDGRKFSKILIRNTLHEVTDRDKLLEQVAVSMNPKGELFIIEVLPTAKKKNHGGCHQPLMTFTEINALAEKNGFLLKEKKEQALNKKTSLQLLRFIKQS